MCGYVDRWGDGAEGEGSVSNGQAPHSQPYQLNTNQRNKLPSFQHLQTLEHP